MDLWFYRDGNGLLPADDNAAKVVRKLGEGECSAFRHVRLRSGRWHRMYFGLCREIGENQDPRRDEHSIDMELRFRAGHKEMVGVLGDQELWVPKRIAFDKLTPEQKKYLASWEMGT